MIEEKPDWIEDREDVEDVEREAEILQLLDDMIRRDARHGKGK